MSGHAKLSPSAAHRWLACPGSIRMCADLLPTPPGEHAVRGTAAHELAAHCLRQYLNPFSLRGVRKTPEGSYLVDDEMAAAVKVYVDYVCQLAPLGLVGEGRVLRAMEKRVEFSADLWGTADCIIYAPATGKLYVIDYKNGRSPVQAAENPQTRIYAAATDRMFQAQGAPVTTLTLAIVQPNGAGEAVDTEDLPAEELREWVSRVLEPGIAATKKPDAPIVAGDHCHWCPARMGAKRADGQTAICPEHTRFVEGVTCREFSPVADTALIGPPEPENLTPRQVARVLGHASLIDSWIKLVQAHAHRLATMGQCIPGYKLVSRRANRTWLDDENAAANLELLLGGQAYAKKIVSPAQAEKALKSAGQNTEIVDALSHKPDAGTTLTAIDDRRAAVASPEIAEFVDSADIFGQ